MTKYILSFIGALVIAGAIYGAYQYPLPIASSFGSTTQGATGNAARQANIYGVALATPGANATSSSILNPTGQDVYITSIKVGCEGLGSSKTAYSGAGLATLTFTVATTSTAAPAVQGTALVGGSTFTIATSSPNFELATSTAGWGAATTTNIWTAGSYLTFSTNATNTAVCTFGADYFQS